jgi:hypothetical protein
LPSSQDGTNNAVDQARCAHPLQGGDFQWVTGLRDGNDDELYRGIADVLESRAILRSVNPPPGSVFFFQG